MCIDEVIRIARSQIGTKESPTGSNRQKYGKWYGMDGEPWCAMFVSWVYAKAGCPLPIIQQGAPSGAAYCPYFEKYAKEHGQWHTNPRKGDLALFHFGKNLAVHIGIVDTVSGSSFTCIEGNTSVSSNDNGGTVMLRSRKVSQCRGFYRPLTDSGNNNPATNSQRLVQLTDPLMYGEDVRQWQKQIKYFYPEIEVDGYYGPLSYEACKRFQRTRGLEVDGIVGPITWKETFKQLS